jgi:hypothetical protein
VDLAGEGGGKKSNRVYRRCDDLMGKAPSLHVAVHVA